MTTGNGLEPTTGRNSGSGNTWPVCLTRELDAILTGPELEALRVGYRERVTDLHLPHVKKPAPGSA